jgi:hypothetical protein
MQTISVGQTIRTTDAWLTAFPEDGINTAIVRDEQQQSMYFELVVVNDQGIASAPAGVRIERYHQDDGPGGPVDESPKTDDPDESPPIITQPETM